MSSLVVISRLSSESHSGSWIWGHMYGSIVDIGFSNGPDDMLFGRPPQPEPTPYQDAGWIRDRFLYVARREGGSLLGTLKVAEVLVEDTYMRGPIDFTGIGVSLYLRADAYAAYVDYVGKSPVSFSDAGLWDGRIRFSVPSRPFKFPMPRGSSKPWDTGTRATGRLRTIRQFDFDQLEVEALGRHILGADPSPERRTDVQEKLLLRSPRQGRFRLRPTFLR